MLLNKAQAVFGAAIGNHHWSARPLLQAKIQETCQWLDPKNHRYGWLNIPSGYPTDPKNMPLWITTELFSKATNSPIASCTPVFLSDAVDLYCIFSDQGQEYEVCYHQFALKHDNSLIMISFVINDKCYYIPLTLVFSHGIPI